LNCAAAMVVRAHSRSATPANFARLEFFAWELGAIVGADKTPVADFVIAILP